MSFVTNQSKLFQPFFTVFLLLAQSSVMLDWLCSASVKYGSRKASKGSEIVNKRKKKRENKDERERR